MKQKQGKIWCSKRTKIVFFWRFKRSLSSKCQEILEFGKSCVRSPAIFSVWSQLTQRF